MFKNGFEKNSFISLINMLAMLEVIWTKFNSADMENKNKLFSFMLHWLTEWYASSSSLLVLAYKTSALKFDCSINKNGCFFSSCKQRVKNLKVRLFNHVAQVSNLQRIFQFSIFLEFISILLFYFWPMAIAINTIFGIVKRTLKITISIILSSSLKVV